jgi:RNA polymerase sigma factor (sigma-70 family)
MQYSHSSNVYQRMELSTPGPEMADKNTEISAAILRERSRLLNFIRRRVGERMDAEDILQDVLFSFVEAFRLPRSIEHASAWLFQVARNRITDGFRKKKEQLLDVSEGGEEERDVTLDFTLPASDAGPEAAYARSALLHTLQEALDDLPDAQREVFIAHELEGKSFNDLSAQTGIGLNTLLARKRYAVAYLRLHLRAAYDELEL